jgi:PQQ-dependent catabolism-associated CXXCW motif protein
VLWYRGGLEAWQRAGLPLGQAQQGYGQQPPQGYGQQPQRGGGASLDELMAWERQDMKVAAPKSLHTGGMHGPTPNTIPGGQVITTKGLVPLLQSNQVRAYVFDVLGGPQQLPNAIPAAAASQPGSFNDETQQRFGQYLQQVTQGNREAPLVFYCQGPQCWMSYNAALRAINLGYKNVLWYRGGIEAWQRAGLPLGQAQQGYGQQGGGYGQQGGGGYGGPQGGGGGYGPQGGGGGGGGYGPQGGGGGYGPQGGGGGYGPQGGGGGYGPQGGGQQGGGGYGYPPPSR